MSSAQRFKCEASNLSAAPVAPPHEHGLHEREISLTN